MIELAIKRNAVTEYLIEATMGPMSITIPGDDEADDAKAADGGEIIGYCSNSEEDSTIGERLLYKQLQCG